MTVQDRTTSTIAYNDIPTNAHNDTPMNAYNESETTGAGEAPKIAAAGSRRSRVRASDAAAFLFAALLSGPWIGCAGDADVQRDTPPSTDREDMPRAAGTEADSWTGILSEEEFKALHALSDEARPAPQGEMVEVAGTQAYLSLPKDRAEEGPVPGIVVIHEWWGLNDHIKAWADRLAADGYAALAVDLYEGKVAGIPDSAMAYMEAVSDDSAMRILRAAHLYLVESPRVRAPRTAVIGWCFGGAWSLQLAMAQPDLDAAVLYYGRLVTDAALLGNIPCPLLAIFGNQDQSIPPERVDAFEAALEEAEVRHEILRYDAPHAFANPSSDRYVPDAAEDAWEHVRRFFAEHLGG